MSSANNFDINKIINEFKNHELRNEEAILKIIWIYKSIEGFIDNIENKKSQVRVYLNALKIGDENGYSLKSANNKRILIKVCDVCKDETTRIIANKLLNVFTVTQQKPLSNTNTNILLPGKKIEKLDTQADKVKLSWEIFDVSVMNKQNIRLFLTNLIQTFQDPSNKRLNTGEFNSLKKVLSLNYNDFPSQKLTLDLFVLLSSNNEYIDLFDEVLLDYLLNNLINDDLNNLCINVLSNLAKNNNKRFQMGHLVKLSSSLNSKNEKRNEALSNVLKQLIMNLKPDNAVGMRSIVFNLLDNLMTSVDKVTDNILYSIGYLMRELTNLDFIKLEEKQNIIDVLVLNIKKFNNPSMLVLGFIFKSCRTNEKLKLAQEYFDQILKNFNAIDKIETKELAIEVIKYIILNSDLDICRLNTLLKIDSTLINCLKASKRLLSFDLLNVLTEHDIHDTIDIFKNQRNLPNDVLKLLIDVLVKHDNIAIRDKALEILKKYKNIDHIKNILYIEENHANLNVIKKILEKNKHLPLTKTCLEFIETNQDKNSSLINDILNVLADNQQTSIPDTLIFKLFNDVKDLNYNLLVKIIKSNGCNENLFNILMGQIKKNNKSNLCILKLLNENINFEYKSINNSHLNSLTELLTDAAIEVNLKNQILAFITNVFDHNLKVDKETIEVLMSLPQTKHLIKLSSLKNQMILKDDKLFMNMNKQFLTRLEIMSCLNAIVNSQDLNFRKKTIGFLNNCLVNRTLKDDMLDCIIDCLQSILKYNTGDLSKLCLKFLSNLLKHDSGLCKSIDIDVILHNHGLKCDSIEILIILTEQRKVTKLSFACLLNLTLNQDSNTRNRVLRLISNINPELYPDIPVKQYNALNGNKNLNQLKENLNYLNGYGFCIGLNGIKAVEALCQNSNENSVYIKELLVNNLGNVDIPSDIIKNYFKINDDNSVSLKSVLESSGKLISVYFDNKINRDLSNLLKDFKFKKRLLKAITNVEYKDLDLLLNSCRINHLSHYILAIDLYFCCCANHESGWYQYFEYIDTLVQLYETENKPDGLDDFLISLKIIKKLSLVNNYLKLFCIESMIAFSIDNITDLAFNELCFELSEWSIPVVEKFLKRFRKTYINDLLLIKQLKNSSNYSTYNALEKLDENANIRNFIRFVHIEEIENFLKNIFNTDNIDEKLAEKLVDLEYTRDLLNSLYDKYPSKIIYIINLIIDYCINANKRNSKGKNIDHIALKPGKNDNVLLDISKLGSQQDSESNNDAKVLETLLIEIKERNKQIDIDQLRNDYEMADAHFNSVKNWSKYDIKRWVLTNRNNSSTDILFALAVLRRANILDSDKDPRIVQILVLILMLKSNKGTLSQINTGEGKTMIVSMLAVMKVMHGEKVDVITSSPILAERDAKEKRSFYEIFGFSVADNGTPGVNVYANDILYGCVSNFQFDFLRDQYKLLSTRQERPFGVVIADEVDSMLIDEGSKIAMLSEGMAGMEYLEAMLSAVWISVSYFIRAYQYDAVTGKTYMIDPSIEGEQLGIEIDDPTMHTIESIKNEMKEKFFHENLKEAFHIPRNLYDFAQEQLPQWIEHAIIASQCIEGKDYIVKNDEILPVDYSNTGVIQSNTQWQNGLHQFLQMKHGLYLTPESFTTSFISNVGYFKNYGKKIYGLTGTLGTNKSKELLESTYDVKCILMPTYKVKKFFELTSIICQNENEWFDQIAVTTCLEINKDRAVLIICESINDVDEIEKILLSNGVSAGKIKKYFDDSIKTDIDEVNSGDVIIATNLAGRGTDIKPTDIVEKNGGLHVCLTFLPSNLRVEEQAFGRTSRQGNKGTGQLVLCSNTNDDSLSNQISVIKQARELREFERLDFIKEHELKEIGVKDDLFVKRFMPFMANLKKNKCDKHVLKAIEERWGLFYAQLDFKKDFDVNSIMSQYQTFFSNVQSDLKNGKAIKSHSYYTLQGNACKNDKETIEKYDKAIGLDPIFAYAAHYNKACSIIKQQHDGYIDKAKESLEKTKKIVTETLIPQLQASGAVTQLRISPKGKSKDNDNNDGDNESSFRNQINAKYCILKQHEIYITNALETIKNRNTNNEIVIETESLLEDFFKDKDAPIREIQEFYNNGMIKFFSVKEKPPTDWLSIIAVFLIGCVQLVAGAVLTAIGMPNLGNALIGEGVGDIITSVKAAVSGTFDWTEYLKDKAISLAVSVATMGFSAIKSAMKSGQGIKAVFTVSKTASTAASKEVFKEGMKVAAKKISYALLEAGAGELIKYGVNFLTEELLKLLNDSIDSKIKEALNNRINRDRLAKIMANQDSCAKIKQVASNIFTRKDPLVLEIGETIFRRIVESKSQSNQTAMLCNGFMKTKDMLQALLEVATCTTKFCNEINSEMKTLAVDENKCVDTEAVDKCMQVWTEQIRASIMNIIHGKVLRPCTNKLIGKAVKKYSNSIQKSFTESKLTIDQKMELFQKKLTVYKEAKLLANRTVNSKHLENTIDSPTNSNKPNNEHDSTGSRQNPDREGHIGDLAAMAAFSKCRVEVYQNGKLYDVLGDEHGGEPLKFKYTPTTKNKQGHWDTLDGTVQSSGLMNNCLFENFSHALNQHRSIQYSSKQLRDISDRVMNSKTVEPLRNAINMRIEHLKPHKVGIMQGGAADNNLFTDESGKRFLKVYRVLNETECNSQGDHLIPRLYSEYLANPKNETLVTSYYQPGIHIADGSKPTAYISTTTSLSSAKKWARKDMLKKGLGRIAEIHIPIENGNHMPRNVIDMTDEHVSAAYINGNYDRGDSTVTANLVRKNAVNSQEVLVLGPISSEWIPDIQVFERGDIRREP